MLQHLGLMSESGSEPRRISWWRFLGVSAFKTRVARRIGIPLTRTGRRQKLGSLILRLLGLERVGLE